MSRGKRNIAMVICGFVSLAALYLTGCLRTALNSDTDDSGKGTYESLPEDNSEGDPLEYIDENFMVKDGFNSNLPVVILSINGELSDYKSFFDGKETVDEAAEPYTDGHIKIISSQTGQNYITDTPVYTSQMIIKKRGHSSMMYDKPQYLMKMKDAAGGDNLSAILGMGEGSDWILNGSMADKSMLRNYLPYRIASEAGGNLMSPDSRYCEVLIEKNGGYEYCGVYLLMETVSRGKSRVDIDKFKKKNTYTGYIVRRDRYTAFDVMLNTYGRLTGLSEEWIGVKYPSQHRLTDAAKQYIEEDFSQIEKVIYSENENTFKVYDKYIDIDTFVDYFLINEFFGNYDAGEHSTYMYKSSGGRLKIGPVWDFDQSMNNYFGDEMDAYTIAFQTKPFFERLSKDSRFIDALKSRYSELRRDILSEEHILEVIDEAAAYLKSARQREWYRWASDYTDNSFENIHNYYLQDYVNDGITVSRFNKKYEQELYIIRTYLHKHGSVIQSELTKLYDLAEFNTSVKNENELLLLVIMLLFLVPSVLINGEKG